MSAALSGCSLALLLALSLPAAICGKHWALETPTAEYMEETRVVGAQSRSIEE
jgi:hypothetical protein